MLVEGWAYEKWVEHQQRIKYIKMVHSSNKISKAFLLVMLIGGGCEPLNSNPTKDMVNAYKVESKEYDYAGKNGCCI